MTTIKTYNGAEADFYIQAKVLHAGRPLRNATPNCFAVYTEVENAYEIIYSLYKSKAFIENIIGSVIPFIRLSDLKKIVLPVLSEANKINNNNLKKIEIIDKNISLLEEQIKKMKQLQELLAKQTIRKK